MNTIRLVAGSIVVYAIVACGSSTGPSLVKKSMDASSPRPFDASSMLVAVRDAIANPVAEASAQALAPIVATETCNKTAQAGGTTVIYAEHAFPGYTAPQLAQIEAIESFSQSGTIPGYTQFKAYPVWLRDGYAAVPCSGSPQSVTFILPQ